MQKALIKSLLLEAPVVTQHPTLSLLGATANGTQGFKMETTVRGVRKERKPRDCGKEGVA